MITTSTWRAALLLVLLASCTIPPVNKSDVRQHQVHEDVKRTDYLTLAYYWDDHATKESIDFKGASFLQVRETERRAEITFGNGPYYGMIELIGQQDGSTVVRTYAWGVTAGKIEAWRQVILNAPENAHPE